MNALNNSRQHEGADDSLNPGKISAFHAGICAFGFAIFVGNITSLVALSRCKRMAKQVRSLSLTLVITDAITGFCLILVPVIRFFEVEDDPLVCIYELIIPRIMAFLSMFTISSFAIDRCLSLWFAMEYVQHVTNSSSVLVPFALSILSMIVTGFSYFEGFHYQQNCVNFNQIKGSGLQFCVTMVCSVIIVGCYGFIFKVIRHHTRVVQQLQSKSENTRERKTCQVQFRTTLKVTTIAIAFVVFFTPIGVYRTYVYFNPETRKVTYTVRQVTAFICLMNSWINPFLYAWRFRECRREILKIIFCWSQIRVEAINGAQKRSFASYLIQSRERN